MTFRCRRSARGMTLFELLLVLAIMVIVAALVIPSVVGFLDSQRLRKTGDQMRAEWNRTRNRAMKTGRIQAFRCLPGSNQYRIEEWSAEDAGDALNTTAPDDNANPLLQSPFVRTLTEGIQFLDAQATADARSTKAVSQFAPVDDEPNWSRPILFYPDGTASTATLVIANQRQYCVRLQLRGLTGTSQASDLMLISELATQ